MSLRLALYQERKAWRPGDVFRATLEATNLSASTPLALSRLACELVGLEIVDRARISPSYASAGAPDPPDRAALAWPPPALLDAVEEEDDEGEAGGRKRPAALHPASSSVPASSRGDARRIVSPPVVLLVGKQKKEKKSTEEGKSETPPPPSPPLSLRPLSSAAWSLSLRLPLSAPPTLRGGPGSPVRYNYRIQALARYRERGARGEEAAAADDGGPSLAAAAAAVRVLPPLPSAAPSARGGLLFSGLLTGAAAEPEPCRYEPGALIKGLHLEAERLPDEEEDEEEEEEEGGSSEDDEEDEEDEEEGEERVRTPPLVAAAAAARKNKRSTSARPSSSTISAPSLLSGGGLVSLSPARRQQQQQQQRPPTAGDDDEKAALGGSTVAGVGGRPAPPLPSAALASTRSFNLRAPGGTLARLTLHGPPDGLPLTPGATLRGTLDLRPPLSPQQAPPSSSVATSDSTTGGGEAGRESALPPPICARFAVALETVEAVSSKWAIRGAASGGGSATSSGGASRRAVAVDETASACAHLRLAHFELSVPPDAPLSLVTPLVSVRWALRLEMAPTHDYCPLVGGGKEGREDDDNDGSGLWARSPSRGMPGAPPTPPPAPAPPRRALPPPPLLEWELPIAVVAPAAFGE